MFFRSWPLRYEKFFFPHASCLCYPILYYFSFFSKTPNSFIHMFTRCLTIFPLYSFIAKADYQITIGTVTQHTICLLPFPAADKWMVSILHLNKSTHLALALTCKYQSCFSLFKSAVTEVLPITCYENLHSEYFTL